MQGVTSGKLWHLSLQKDLRLASVDSCAYVKSN